MVMTRPWAPLGHCGTAIGRYAPRLVPFTRYSFVLVGSGHRSLEPSAGSKDIITLQVEFGDWQKMVIGGADLGNVEAGRNTHCVLVECEQDVPFSEELLRIANGGTPVILVTKALVVQDWVDQNAGDGASQMCNFSTNSTVYLDS